jgi:restriction system protein
MTFFNNLKGWEFENLIDKLVRAMGFHTEDRKRGPDGGIDILALKDEPLLQGKYVIQCKRHSNPVGVEVIRDLYGVVHSTNANKGILITNSTFTDAAIEFSIDKQLELIDGAKLHSLLDEYELLESSIEVKEIPISVLTTYDHFARAR